MSRPGLAVAGVAVLALCACSTAPREDPAPSIEVDVYAAASLNDVFTTLAAEFEAAEPGVTIVLTFAGSSDLAAHIVEGAPADVFAPADVRQMELVAGLTAGEPTIFAANVLTIAVPSGNPAGVTDFASLSRPGLVLVTCAPDVPCGVATATLAERLAVDLSPASEEPSVTDVLGKVASGEADAGLVYVTDIARADGVEGIAFDGADLAVNEYPIAALTGGDAGASADAFVAFVLGDRGQAVLAEAGFRAP